MITWRAAALPLALGITLAVDGCAASDDAEVDPDQAEEEVSTSTPIERIEEQQHNDLGLGDGRSGDLWVSCWSDDDRVYVASGDGRGFSDGDHLYDIAVSRISGRPPKDGSPSTLSGEFLAGGNDIAQNFSGRGYNRKPTGMLCRGGDVYLATGAMGLDGQHYGSSSISVSHDRGRTWTWGKAPIFKDATFTTIFFLDYGKDSRDAKDDWVYVYGTDGSWKARNRLYLARVRTGAVLDRAAWTFFAGMVDGKPHFVSNIEDKRAVLLDERMVGGQGPIAQGSVVYLPKLGRYLYSSWTARTHEFYESPKPWGPWRHIHQTEFGPYPWSRSNVGGYGTTTPSKFIDPSGKTLWLQSNCYGRGHGCSQNFFSLRRLRLFN